MVYFFRTYLLAIVSLFIIGQAEARVWTNSKGATVTAKLIAVRATEVDLQLLNGRIVSVERTIFSGEDQNYIQQWEQSGGTLAEQDDAGDIINVRGMSLRQVNLTPNWDALWPKKAGFKDLQIIKTVQESDDLCVYESDLFIFESPIPLHEEERRQLTKRFELSLRALAEMPLNLTVARKPSRKYLVRVCFSQKEMAEVHGLQRGRVKFTPTSFTALLFRDKRNQAQNLDELDTRFAVTHWALQTLDLDHWLVDSFSEYMEFLPVEDNQINFTQVPKFMAKRLPKNIKNGKKKLMPLESILARKDIHLSALHEESTKDKELQYWTDLLWLVYLCHLEDEGKATRFRAYVKTLSEQNSTAARQELLKGTTILEMQSDLVKAWKKFGVKLQFCESKNTSVIPQ